MYVFIPVGLCTPYVGIPVRFYLLLIGSYVLLIWIAAAQSERQSLLLRLLDNRFTNWLGDLSYSLYLWHVLVLLTGCELLHYLAPGLTDWWYAQTNPLLGGLSTLLMLMLLVGISWLSYTGFERPIQRRLRRWQGAKRLWPRPLKQEE